VRGPCARARRAPADSRPGAQIVGVLGPPARTPLCEPRGISLLRCHPRGMRQRSFAPEVHPDDFERVKALVDRSVANPAAYELEMRPPERRRDLSLVSGSVQSPPRRPGPADSVYPRV